MSGILEDPPVGASPVADDGPGVLRELWHGVTEGAFDHFFTTGFDAFGVIMFFAVGSFFACFVYPFMLRSLDNMTKFELTPEMQEELKGLMEKKKKGEFSTKSKLLERIMEHQEKRDSHEEKMANIQKKIAIAHAGSTGGGAKAEAAAADKPLRQRTAARTSEAAD